MPNPENPEYILWKKQLEKELDKLNGDVILVGHSLGGSVLLKYLSE
nr:alpha/beta hydrolase [Salipaludibacillus sp. CUR1]